MKTNALPGGSLYFQIHKIRIFVNIPKYSLIVITFNNALYQQVSLAMVAPFSTKFNDAPTDVIGLLLCDSLQYAM